ncbi:MAG: ElaA protein [Psychromonas sp.]|jgi:ElaA protein
MGNSEDALYWELKKFNQLSNEELYELIALRSQVFVVEQNCVYQDLDFKDQEAFHLLGKNEGRKLIAYTRLFDINQYYEGYLAIGRVITHQDFRKYGYGIELMKKSIELCHTTFGQIEIKIGAQKYLCKFYSLLGFKEIGEDYIEDGIPHCIMIREI